MRKIFFAILFSVVCLVSNAKEKEITATIIIENETNQEFTSGELTIIDLNQKIEVNNTNSFTVTLPEKGEYKFEFVTEDFAAMIFYPSKINKRHNTITVRLMDKDEVLNQIESKNKRQNNLLAKASSVNTVVSLSSELKSNMTDEEIQERINNGTVSFIIHGLTDYIPEEYVKFKEKYGIGLRVENCSVGVFDNVIENNQRIFNYLNQKYGEEWQNELESKPFGIE